MVGPRIISRPSALTSCAMAWASRCTSAVSQLAAIATPDGNDVVSTLTAFADELVIAELPAQERTPMGPSAIFIEGMPRRWIAADSIQPEPASMVAFSLSVIRFSKSCTRWSIWSAVFLYGGPVCDAAGEAFCAQRNKALSAAKQSSDEKHERKAQRMDW